MKNLSIQKGLRSEDRLTRFLFHSSDINFQTESVRTSVFSKKHPDGFSVFQTTSLDHHKVWEMGKKYAAPNYEKQTPPRPMLGRFDLEARHYTVANLTIQKDSPPPKHYSIFGLPVSSAAQAKQLSQRQILVNKAQTFLIQNNVSWSKYGLID